VAEAAEPPARRSRRLLYALVSLAVLVVVLGGAIVYFMVTFDAREYRDYLVRVVKEMTGRTMRIVGERTL
jgi:uncharacterized protein involved in outer membrane biogenesis